MATFTKINEGEVSSSEGYTLKVSYHHVTYREGNLAVQIEAEHCPSPYKLVVYVSAMTAWCPPHQREPLDQQLKSKVAARVSAALTALGVNHEVE